LRKEKIDEYILRRREKLLEKVDERSPLEINPENLKLSPEIKNKNFTSIVNYLF